MSRTKLLRIGIASRDQMKARTLAIARGEHRPDVDEPKVWFTSLQTLGWTLSNDCLLRREVHRHVQKHEGRDDENA